MKIEKGKIVEATESELLDYYLKRELDTVMSFADFKGRMKDAGVKIGRDRHTRQTIEYGVQIGGDNGTVDNCHFSFAQDAYEYMNTVLAKVEKLNGIELKVVRRNVGEWKEDTDD